MAMPGETITYTNQPTNLVAYRLGLAAAHARPGGDCIDHGLSLLQELQRRGFGVVAINPSEPEGVHYHAAQQPTQPAEGE